MSKNKRYDRKTRLSVFAKAKGEALRGAWNQWTSKHGSPEHEVLRAPEIGTVMVRGRAGAVGAAFNLGEITVTRCSVRTADGSVGHGYVQGRDKAASLAAALIDALSQGAHADGLDTAITAPLEQEMLAQKAKRAAKANATKVEFFTMVRGEG